jgi:hypothetical protein
MPPGRIRPGLTNPNFQDTYTRRKGAPEPRVAGTSPCYCFPAFAAKHRSRLIRVRRTAQEAIEAHRK